MGDRVSQTILLCEDEAHERLAKNYMKSCGISKTVEPYVRSVVASKLVQGGNVHWVLNEFPKQLHACRQRQSKANTLLIVLIDADAFESDERKRELMKRVTDAGYEEFRDREDVALLIPKRNVETWIKALLGIQVNETEDYKTRTPATREEFKKAAMVLYAWARPNVDPGDTCVPSLRASIPEWRKIG